MADEQGKLALDPVTAVGRMFRRCADDALIAFGSRRPPPRGDGPAYPRFLWTLRVSKLVEYIPAVMAFELENTGYVMPNTLATSALTKPLREYEEAIRLREPIYYAAKNENVRELAAVVVDLDVGRDGDTISGHMAVAMIHERCELGELPWPSMTAVSGRGAYLWYLLVDDSRERAPVNDEENRQQWKLIVNALVNKTKDLKADANAMRLANWFKRPGTVDTKTGNRVVFSTIGIDNPGNMPEYTLPELMVAFDLYNAPVVEPATSTRRIESGPWEPSQPRHANGPRPARTRIGKSGNPAAPHHKRVQELEQLAVEREGMREGHRHQACWHYYCSRRAYLLNVADHSNRHRAVLDAQRDTRLYNQKHCRPPLHDQEVAKVFNELSRKKYNPRGTTIASHVGVTDDEAKNLGFIALATPAVRAEMRATKAAKASHRQNRLTQCTALLKQGKTVKEVAQAWDGQNDHSQIQKDTLRFVQRQAKKLRELGSLPG